MNSIGLHRRNRVSNKKIGGGVITSMKSLWSVKSDVIPTYPLNENYCIVTQRPLGFSNHKCTLITSLHIAHFDSQRIITNFLDSFFRIYYSSRSQSAQYCRWFQWSISSTSGFAWLDWLVRFFSLDATLFCAGILTTIWVSFPWRMNRCLKQWWLSASVRVRGALMVGLPFKQSNNLNPSLLPKLFAQQTHSSPETLSISTCSFLFWTLA